MMPSSSCSGSVRGEQACGSTDLMLPQAGMTLSGCICQEHAGTATCQCLVDSFRVAGGSTMLADAPCAEVDCTASSRSDKEREAGKRNVEEGNGIEMEEVAGAELPSASSWKKPLDQNVLSALKGDEIVRAQNWKAELAEKGKEVGMTDEEPSSSTSSASRGDENETTNLLSEVQTNVRYMFSATDVYTFVCITVWVSLCCAIVRRRMAMWIVGFSFIAFEVASLLLGLCDKQRSFTNSLTAAAEITVTYTVASERGQHHTQPALPQRRDLYHSTLIAYIHSLIASIGVGIVFLQEGDKFPWGMYREHGPWAYIVVGMSCGFFAYDLWDIVQRRLYNPRAPSILFHHVAVLVCFTTALYRGVGINYLVLLMASEINSVFGHQRRMLRLLGVPDGGLVSTMNWVCNWFTFIAARVVPCALLSVLLILDWGSFPIMFFIVSSIGMTCVNLLNVQLFTSLLKAYCHDMQTRDGLHLDHGSRKED